MGSTIETSVAAWAGWRNPVCARAAKSAEAAKSPVSDPLTDAEGIASTLSMVLEGRELLTTAEPAVSMESVPSGSPGIASPQELDRPVLPTALLSDTGASVVIGKSGEAVALKTEEAAERYTVAMVMQEL